MGKSSRRPRVAKPLEERQGRRVPCNVRFATTMANVKLAFRPETVHRFTAVDRLMFVRTLQRRLPTGYVVLDHTDKLGGPQDVSEAINLAMANDAIMILFFRTPENNQAFLSAQYISEHEKAAQQQLHPWNWVAYARDDQLHASLDNGLSVDEQVRRLRVLAIGDVAPCAVCGEDTRDAADEQECPILRCGCSIHTSCAKRVANTDARCRVCKRPIGVTNHKLAGCLVDGVLCVPTHSA